MSQTELKAALQALGGCATSQQIIDKLQELFPRSTIWVKGHWYREAKQMRKAGELTRERKRGGLWFFYTLS